MSELFTQELLKKIQEDQAEFWREFWQANESKGGQLMSDKGTIKEQSKNICSVCGNWCCYVCRKEGLK